MEQGGKIRPSDYYFQNAGPNDVTWATLWRWGKLLQVFIDSPLIKAMDNSSQPEPAHSSTQL